jgi:hypothetical protein
MAANDEGEKGRSGRTVQVRIIEPRKGERAPEGETEAPTVHLSLQETRDYIEPFIEDGYIVLARRADGSGHVLRSKRELPSDVTSVVIIRAMRGRDRAP